MKDEHTPGPWHTDTDGNIRDTKNQIVASTYIGSFGVPESNANAKLIAAAPDLAEALQKMLFQAPRISRLIDSHSDRDWFDANRNDARAALAKAGVE